ncbi:hypothetical protein TraAM80_03619 [Trypanosoma rangeli]|uniref:SAM-dependent MTase RsmB/NOP-type domain-containing protein n=1 Tax=Trypanosoma rangeli TaxID=5698 RepID=A0A422NNK7_TRYRA|nr:uncharacterized protein TraAM80_03619 [Trypanosoma rangeli]RNF07006.1 hypothetical protein TraAM80_03619 [Trypanosoma rangeli]|eukprot:RNF07006.1 hypothetical protein TraAM80_03619 [Trypanosoma rangeli]
MSVSCDAATRGYPETFTEEFVRYCHSHHLPPQLFYELGEVLATIPRYIRLRPQYVKDLVIPAEDNILAFENATSQERYRIRAGIAASFGISSASVEEVEWLPHPYCYAIPRGVAMCRAAMYESGIVSAMDAASVAAVVALRPSYGDLVWDVCCSPGMKLSFIADAIGETGVAVGTDISLARLFTARSVLKKHQTNNVCLFAADGTLFSLQGAAAVLDEKPSSQTRGRNGLTLWEERQLRRFQKRRVDASVGDATASSGVKEVKEIRVAFSTDPAREMLCRVKNRMNEHQGFDRVLVDVECSHDGSLAHIFLNDATRRPFATAKDTLAPASAGIDNAHRMWRLNLALQMDETDAKFREELSTLLQLQLGLLQNGYAQLKPGGTLVYCTCSFTYQQNEFIVRETVSRVNASNEVKQQYKGEAVICHPFAYTHETVSPEVISPIVRLTDAQATSLQQRLKMDTDPYGILRAGGEEINNAGGHSFTGVRFWPHTFATSFQFVSKIWKRPLSSLSVE